MDKAPCLEKLINLPCFSPISLAREGEVFVYVRMDGAAPPLWSFTPTHRGIPVELPLLEDPWHLERWCLKNQILELSELDFDFSLDLRQTSANLYQLCRIVADAEIALEVKVEQPGSYWIFGSFTAATDAVEKVHVGDDGPALYTDKSFWGVKMTVYQKENFLVFNETEHFAVGRLPQDFMAMIPELVLGSFGLTRADTAAFGIYEQKVALKAVREKLIKRLCKGHFSDDEWDELLRSFRPPAGRLLGRTAFSDASFHFGYRNSGEESIFPAAIEVLEERELRSKYSGLDDAITYGKFEQIGREWTALIDAAATPYFFRRAAMLAMIGRHTIDPAQLDEYLQADPENLLFLSLKIVPCFSSELAIELLRPLSALGAALVQKSADFAQIHFIDLIFSELFGDAWFCVDFGRSLNSYSRVIDEPDNIARILIKIIRLSRHWGEEENEVSYSFRYLKICAEESGLVYLYFRLAQLLWAGDLAEATRCARKALHIDPGNERYALFVADLLLKAQKPSDAIDVLTSTIDVLALGKTGEKARIAALKLAIGRIWLHELRRKDLALERFKDALDLLDPEVNNIALLFQLQEIFVEVSAPDALITAYEKLFTANLAINNMAEIMRLKPLIFAVYQAQPGFSDKLCAFYRRLIDHNLLNVDEIQHVMALQDKSPFDWARIYAGFLKGKEPAGDEEKIFYQKQLGDIALTYLGDRKLAMGHYWQVISYGEIDPGLFHLLFSYYQQIDAIEEYFRHLKELTENASKNLKRVFLSEIMRHSEYLADDEIDNYLISLLRVDPATAANLSERFGTYLSRNDCESGYRLLSVAVDGLDDPAQKISLLWSWISQLERSKASQRFDYMNRIYQKLTALGAPRHEVRRDAVRNLFEDPSGEFLVHYVEEMLLNGEMPELPADYIEQTFTDRSAVIGRYYEIAIFGTPGSEPDIAKAFKLLDIIEGAQIYREREFDLLRLMAGKVWLGLSRIERLRDFLLSAALQDEYEVALRAQLALVPPEDKDTQVSVLRLCIQFFDGVLADSNKLFEALDRLHALLPSQLPVMIQIAEFAYKYQKHFKAKTMVFHCLDDETFWENTDAVNQVFNWMVHEWDERSIIANIVRNKLQAKIKARDWAAADRIAVFLEKFELYDLKTAFMAFEAAAERGDEERMTRAFIEANLKIENGEILGAFFRDCEKLIERTGRMAHFHRLLMMQLPVDKNPFLKVAEEEYQLMLATKYPGAEMDEQKSYDILHNHFAAYPDDARSWMPLYFILKGRDERLELIGLLRHILPRLEEDEQALAQFPVTLESLRDEVVKYEDLVGMPQTHDSGHKRLITGDGQVSLERDGTAQLASLKQTGASVESLNIEMKERTAEEEEAVAQQLSPENWREVVMSWQMAGGMTEMLVDMPFAHQMEKHVAVQAFALITGEYSALRRWSLQVWRDVDKFTYPRSSRERTRSIVMIPAAFIPFFNEFGPMTPFLLKQNTINFSVTGLAHKLAVRAEDIIAMRRSVSWNDIFFDKTLIRHYADQLNQMQFVIFNIKGLGRDLFYDVKYRALYFDVDYFSKMPPSYIFHRIMLHLRAVMAGYHPWLFADLRGSVMPFVEKARETMQNSLVSTMKSSIGLGFSPGEIVGETAKRGHVRRFFQQKEIGLPEVEAMIQGMWQYLYAWQAAETLDFIGLYEAILGVDIATLKAREIRLASSSHGEIRELLAFATRLTFDE